MVVDSVETIFAVLFSTMVILYLTNDRLFTKVSNLLVLLLRLILVFLLALPSVIWMSVQAATKVILFSILSIVLLVVYSASFPVQVLGRFNPGKIASTLLSGFIDENQSQRIRINLTRMLAKKERDKPFVYRSSEYYRNEMSRILNQTEARISQGEKTLSLLFGFLLLLTSADPISIPKIVDISINIQNLARTYLFFVSIIVLFRIAFLEILMFDGTEEFESPAHMDVAVTLQEATSRFSFLQFSQIVLSFAKIFSSHQVDIGLQILDELVTGKLPLSISKIISRMKELQTEYRGSQV